MEEGISHEASSLAGHQQLGNLVVLYDDNHISIEDDTNVAKSEDVCGAVRGLRLARAARWTGAPPTATTRTCPALYAGAPGGPAARPRRRRIIALRTIIGWPAPNKQNTGAAHGAALGEDEVAATKEILGFDPDVNFAVEDEVLSHARQVAERGTQAHAEWDEPFEPGPAPTRSAGAVRPAGDPPAARRLGRGAAGLPAGRQGHRHPHGLRQVLNALAPVLPELWGGSADLAE